MKAQLKEILDCMHTEGKAHDSDAANQAHHRRNLDPDSAALLAALVRISGAKQVVEVGTSNGYSTIWLADAVSAHGGMVTTIDLVQQDEAIANATWAGVEGVISFVHADAGTALKEIDDHSVDFIFLDTDRTRYLSWWPDIDRILAPGGVVVLDNLLSPAPEELEEFVHLLESQDSLKCTRVPVGAGLLVVERRGHA